MNFDNKTAWITGASSGIGKALALALAEKKCHLILSARRVEKLAQLKTDCEANGINARVVPLDLADVNALKTIVKNTLEQTPKIDYLFNNGGISQRDKVGDTQLETDRRIFEVNYFGTIALTKMVLPKMISQGGGHIIVTSSMVGLFGFPLRSAYAASKHALHGFFDSMRFEYAEENIKVMMVCPGRIQTDISISALNGDGSQYGQLDPGQATGMPVEKCAQQILRGIDRNQKTVIIGSLMEYLFLKMYTFTPSLFRYLVPKISAK